MTAKKATTPKNGEYIVISTIKAGGKLYLPGDRIDAKLVTKDMSHLVDGEVTQGVEETPETPETPETKSEEAIEGEKKDEEVK